MIGQMLGPYRITAEVARGGQATLYKAVHTILGRETALKVLHPHLITVADFLQKFAAESRILARLKHPNIVTVYDAGADKGFYWIAMEWLDGQAVDDLIAQQGKLPVDLAVRIADQVAAALEYAHAQGLIHRDIKPGNMMLLPDGTVKVLDFGIAAIVAAGQKAVTRIGTVEYMSYEQFNGQADQRSDLYSLGASLYEMLTGQLPPRLALHPPTPPRQLNPAIPPGLEQLLYRLLAQRPEDRPQTALAFRQRLQTACGFSATQPNTVLRCHHCGSQNRVGAKYCQACGKKLATTLSAGMGPLRVVKEEKEIRPWTSAATQYSRPQFLWSPRGHLLAVLRRESFTLYDTRAERLSGKHILIPFMSFESEELSTLSWYPDGNEVTYAEAGKVLSLGLSVLDGKVDAYSDPDRFGRYLNEMPGLPIGQTTLRPDADEDNPIWSPDGQLLLYRARVKTTGNYEWRLLDSITKQIRRVEVYSDPSIYNLGPEAIAWSPDGSYLAFGSDVIQICDRSGQLVAKLPPRGIPPLYWFDKRWVDWIDNRRLIAGGEIPGSDERVHGIIEVFDTGTKKTEKILIGDNFVVSPDRKWIALQVDRYGPTWWSEIHDRELYDAIQGFFRQFPYDVLTGSFIVLINVDDYRVVRLLTKEATVEGWSPDSNKVLFTTDSAIWVVNVNGTGLQRLTEGHAPQWSPDGRHIAFLRSPKYGEYELWVMRVETA